MGIQRLIPYSYLQYYIHDASSDKYVRLMIRVIAMEEYIRTGKYSKELSKRLLPSYPIDRLIADIGVTAGTPLSKIFLSYTIMRIAESWKEWNIIINDNDRLPYLMSNKGDLVMSESIKHSLISERQIIDSVLRGYKILCNIDTLIQYYPLMIVTPIPAYAELHLKEVIGPYHPRLLKEALRLLGPGTDIMKGIHYMESTSTALPYIRRYISNYRVSRAYDTILSSIPSPACITRHYPHIPRHDKYYHHDIDIITEV